MVTHSNATIQLGLARIIRLLDHLSQPQQALPRVIHVAGTNGKGSICAYLTSILREAAWKVGCFNSPHLLSPHDALSINGQSIPAEMYQVTLDRVKQVDACHAIKATPFELVTAVMFVLFAQLQLDIVVLEVGLGGTLDATNVCTSIACVFASLGLDHQSFLGDTIEAIASHKAGIIKTTGLPVIIGPQSYPSATQVIVDRAKLMHSPAIVLVEPAVRIIRDPDSSSNQVSISYHDHNLICELPLLGDFQLANVATAIKTFEVLNLAHPVTGLGITAEHIRRGVASTRWRGRLEWLDSLPGLGTRVLIDGAHNIPAAIELLSFVRKFKQPVWWIMACTEGKDVGSILACLLRSGDRLTVLEGFTIPEGMPWIKPTPFSSFQSAFCQSDALLNLQGQVDIDCYPSFSAMMLSLNSRRNSSPSAAHLPVICGSLYLVADVLRSVE